LYTSLETVSKHLVDLWLSHRDCVIILWESQ
jgi:hypothetical protein